MTTLLSRLRHRSGLLLIPLASIACSSTPGGAEGEAPGPPCPYGSPLLRAHITELVGSCVGVEVDDLVSAGVPLRRSNGSVLFDGTAEPGETVRGRLLAYYAYTHSFQLNENVAVLVGSFDADLGLQLLPLAGDVVQLQWGKRPVAATLTELASPECPSLLMAKYEAADADRSTSHTATAPPTSMCPP